MIFIIELYTIVTMNWLFITPIVLDYCAYPIGRTIYDSTLRHTNEFIRVPRKPIYLVLDNVYDTYNIGSIFRIADSIGVSKIIICGIGVTPPNNKIRKASVGSCQTVEWEYFEKTSDAIDALRKIPDMTICALEQDKNSVPFHNCLLHYPYTIVLGNESSGVSKSVLESCDKIIEIPMYGVCNSLNVMISSAIALYHLEHTMM